MRHSEDTGRSRKRGRGRQVLVQTMGGQRGNRGNGSSARQTTESRRKHNGEARRRKEGESSVLIHSDADASLGWILLTDG